MDIVVLGAGFGGLAAANELRSLLPPRDTITVVDRRSSFSMGFAKLWDLARVRPLEEGTAALARLEDANIGFLCADVTGIEPAGRQVETSAGALTTDGLIVALGAGPAARHRELLDHPTAHDLYDAERLPAMHAALDGVSSGRVVVAILGGPFKCPPAPYEAALIVDERLRARGVRDRVAVTLATPQPLTLPAAGPDASRYLAETLGERGVEVLTSMTVEAIDDHAITFTGGSGLDYSILLGVPADEPPAVLAPLLGGTGWVEPDPRTLRTSFERVYAVGDCTRIPTATAQLPHAGVFAAAQGQVAARNLVAELVGSDPATFDGHGACFLELPGKRVAIVEGDFYADPPDVTLSEADHEQFLRKQAYEQERLAAWLG